MPGCVIVEKNPATLYEVKTITPFSIVKRKYTNFTSMPDYDDIEKVVFKTNGAFHVCHDS